MTSSVSTSLTSSTEPIENATFPKIVICNKYKLRFKNIYANPLSCYVSFSNRQSFVNSIVSSLRSFIGTRSNETNCTETICALETYTGTKYTDEDIGFVFYKQFIAGWGYFNDSQQQAINHFMWIDAKRFV